MYKVTQPQLRLFLLAHKGVYLDQVICYTRIKRQLKRYRECFAMIKLIKLVPLIFLSLVISQSVFAEDPFYKSYGSKESVKIIEEGKILGVSGFEGATMIDKPNKRIGNSTKLKLQWFAWVLYNRSVYRCSIIAENDVFHQDRFGSTAWAECEEYDVRELDDML